MAGALTDELMEVAPAGAATTLASPGKAVGASSINVANVANFPTDTGFILAIRSVDASGNEISGTYTEWIADLGSGDTFNLNTTPVYGTDQVYQAGSSTQVFTPVSSYAHNLLIKALLKVFNQDMTLVSGLTLPSPIVSGTVDGWIEDGGSWSYASASTINVPDGTKYQVGWRVKFTQSSTVKYGIISSISGNVLTLLMLNSATVANSTISSNYYSLEECPLGVQSILWTSYTNSGSAGGSGHYTIHVDGTKECRGQTATNSSHGSAAYGIDWPSNFFNSIYSIELSVNNLGTDTEQLVASSSGNSTSSIIIYCVSVTNSTSATQAVTWVAVGT